MAPRLTILIFSGSKKGTQACFPFRAKSPGKGIPSRSANGTPIEMYPLAGHFYISLDISFYLIGPKKRTSFHISQKRGPYANGRPFQSITEHIFRGYQVKEALRAESLETGKLHS
jgi:hypothetical protein